MRVHEESVIRYNYLYAMDDYVGDAINKRLAALETEDNQFDVDIIDTAGLMSESDQRTMQYCLDKATAFSHRDAMDLFGGKVKPVTNEFIKQFKK